MLRSRCRYTDMGEKPRKYFLNLESRNFTSKVITKLVDANDVEYVNTNEIINQQEEYYKTSYSETIHIDDKPLEETLGENNEKSSEKDSSGLEGEKTYSELSSALRNMKNGKSPGNDGFTIEFFKNVLARFRNVHIKIIKLWLQNRISFSNTETGHNNVYS